MKTIKLNNGGFSKVSDQDYFRVNNLSWYKDHYGYAVETKTKIKMHRFILNYKGKMDIDHIDRDKLNNSRKNLRVVTRSLNMFNLSKKVGVTWDKERKKWMAKITVNYKTIFLGRYQKIEEAFKAYEAYKKLITSGHSNTFNL